MSHEDTGNLIVGDVKQSIYRWRSGDWRLLAGIRQQFTHADERIDVRKLDTNYRSSRHVVSFNNIFFTRAAEAEQVAAYDDVAQKVPAGKGHDGYVQVTLLPANDYQQQTLRVLANQISTLTCQGINPTDIAILVRTNSNIPIIANYLMEQIPSLSVVSDEAFRLDSSPAVQTIIQAMRLLNDPDDAISRAYLQKVYSGRLDGPLPEGYTPTLLQLPLYELAEQLYSLFGLDRMSGQTAYLCAFYDQVASFVSDYAADVTAFLHEWDESVASKTIQSPEINGLRIISIHKSKGLEFPIVLIPFCDWRLEHNDILWCRPQEAPFNELPLAPIDYSQKGMSGTIYHNDYEEEHLQNVVDNLNLLYVAFTRASSQLYVYGRRGAKGSRSALIEQVLPEVAVELNDALLSGENDEQAPLTLAYGDVTSFHTTTRSRLLTSNPFLQQSMPVSVNIEVNTQKVVFRQSNKSREFAALTDETPNKSAATKPSYIQIGCVLHNLFSTIRTTDDVEKALKQLEQDGILYDDAITRERLEDMIRKRLASPRVAEWFAPDRWTLFNECTILGIDPATGQTCERRPDRVMTDGHETIVVDFKFGTERDEYHEQVREYMQLLTHMGMPCVKGYLWLVYSNKVIEVKR
jgi:ATP-dependent exoDNAse (exonuclease V) beta subunit